jgi:competence protein ComEC
MILMVVGCFVLTLVIPLILSRRWVVLVVSVAMVAMMLLPPYQPGFPGKDWQVALCDVGQGDAMVVRTGAHQAIVVDTGPPGGSVVTCLRQLGIRQIPLVVLSHFHDDHTGGFESVASQFDVGTVLVPTGAGDSEMVLLQAQSHGIPVAVGVQGSSAEIGEVRLVVVSAWNSQRVSTGEGESAQDNDESLVVRLDTPQMSVLVTGDIEVAGQQEALKNREQLRVDVLKVPHHGSASHDVEFFRATGAQIAVIGVGEGNVYGHPASSTMSDLRGESMVVIRTDEHGSFTLTHQGDWSITAQR